MTSVNTNYGALVALQNLNATNKQLEQVQNRINTGLKVGSAKDNGAVFAIAEGLRTRVGALQAVNDGIDRANIAIDTALSAGAAIGDVLKQLKTKAADAQGAGLTADQKAALQADFDALRASITQIADSATFNGINLVNGSNTGANALSVLTTDGGSGGGGAGASAAGNFVAGTDGGGTKLSRDQVILGTGGLTNVDVNDSVQFVLTNTDDGTTTTYNVEFVSGESIEDFLGRVGSETGGRVTASFDDANGVIQYSTPTNYTFTADYVEAAGTSVTAAVQGIFSGNGTGAGTSSAYYGGGGYQFATTALTGAAPALGALLSEIDTGLGSDTGADFVTFTVGSAGSQRTYQVALNASDTLQEFLNSVAEVTGGDVSAQYDQSSGRIIYRSADDFTAATTDAGTDIAAATETFFGNGAAANLAPSLGAASGAGSTSTTVSGYDFRVGFGALATVTNSLNLETDAAGAEAAIATAITALNLSLATLGSKSKALDVQKDFLQKLSDNVEKGVGSLVDADLAKESARLQALQIKQQLGAQALSIANQQPSILLSFFR